MSKPTTISGISQPIVHSGNAAKECLDWMIDRGHLKNAFTKPDNITYITCHNYIDDETGTAESKLHRYNQLYRSEDDKKITMFEKSLEWLGIGSPVVLTKPVCGHHITDSDFIEKYGMYSHIMKEEWVLEYLESDKFPNTELVMWCDAGDVIFIDSPQRIIDVFYEYDCDLLYSTTGFYHGNKGGYHDDFMEGSAKWQNNLKPGLYLNAGVAIGRADFAKEVLREMLEFKWDKRFTQHPPEAPEHMKMADDQEVLRYLHPMFYPRMKIDNEDGRKLAWRH